jgi:hypothetical protein
MKSLCLISSLYQQNFPTLCNQAAIVLVFIAERQQFLCLELQTYLFLNNLFKLLDFGIHDHVSYYNGSDQRIARQRLRKHIPTRNNKSCVSVDGCYSSLLGSSEGASELAE